MCSSDLHNSEDSDIPDLVRVLDILQTKLECMYVDANNYFTFEDYRNVGKCLYKYITDIPYSALFDSSGIDLLHALSSIPKTVPLRYKPHTAVDIDTMSTSGMHLDFKFLGESTEIATQTGLFMAHASAKLSALGANDKVSLAIIEVKESVAHLGVSIKCKIDAGFRESHPLEANQLTLETMKIMVKVLNYCGEMMRKKDNI